MTVRVTTLKEPLAGVYYVEQLPSYYLQAGEPHGQWLGRAAEQLGLSGEVDDEAFLTVMAGMDRRTEFTLAASAGPRPIVHQAVLGARAAVVVGCVGSHDACSVGAARRFGGGWWDRLGGRP